VPAPEQRHTDLLIEAVAVGEGSVGWGRMRHGRSPRRAKPSLARRTRHPPRTALFLSLLGNPPCVRLPIKPRLAVERAFGREFNSVGALFSDKALDGFHVADHDRPLAKIDQAPAMPVLEDLVNAFPAAARHVAELAL